jgi:hypothetical protein
MNRRQAVLAIGGLAAASGDVEADQSARDVRVPTTTGYRDITGKEAEVYHAANAWLDERLKEAESIRVGNTYADVVKVFRRDGGLSSVTKHRFVLILCPFLKIDIEFEDTSGVKVRYPVPDTARVARVSKPYFEREFLD